MDVGVSSTSNDGHGETVSIWIAAGDSMVAKESAASGGGAMLRQ